MSATEPSDLEARVRALHKPWWEHDGVRHYQYVLVYGSPREGHVCISDGLDRCEDYPDYPDDSEHYYPACVECRPMTSDGEEGYKFWPCPTLALLDEVPEKCSDCGHLHTPNGCTGEPTPSDLWAGVSPAVCDCMDDPAAPVPAVEGLTDFAVAVTAFAAGRIDGQQAVASVMAIHERIVAQRVARAKAEGAAEVRERVEVALADLDRGNGYRGSSCGVCSGHSPSRDGHSRNCLNGLPDRIRAALGDGR